jgi:2-polyprenyl-3-methyl-5-hydroxy-6-metoxy-1,4-benzoquinol methylase
MENLNYLEVNRNSWNDRVETHLKSDFYKLDDFKKGWNSLKEIELPLLGDLRGKKVLHLQCHFGQDTLSMARMGAKCTGIDLSNEAIDAAKKLNAEMGLDAEFIACDVYSLGEHLKEKFDIIFTSYGTIGWLPDLDRWAAIIDRFLKADGSFVFAEFHPVVWMFDDNFEKIKYSYFNRDIIKEEESGTYADREADIKPTYISWNHNMAEVLTALMKINLSLESFLEFDYSPYNCFAGTVEFEPGKFRIKGMEEKLPMVYALKANRTN